MKDQILKLRAEGKTYKEIQAILGCSAGTVSYYCNPNKERHNRNNRKYRAKRHPYLPKIAHFTDRRYQRIRPDAKGKITKIIYDKIRDFNMSGTPNNQPFTLEDVISKFTENPVCYLTGKQLNIYEPKTYQFDHVIPASKGGDNSLDNLGIASSEANQAKRDMTPQQFLELCKAVVLHHGHTIS